MKARKPSSRFVPSIALAALILAALACNVPGAEADTTPIPTVTLTPITSGSPTSSPPVPVTVATHTPAPITETSPPPTATRRPITPTTTPTPPSARTGNGPNLTVARCTTSLSIDARVTDWDTMPAIRAFALDTVTFGAAEWVGAGDLRGSARLCWTDDTLAIFVDVIDDAHVQTQRGETSWKGDEVEIVFDGNLRADFYEDTWDNDDYQLGLSPGNFADLRPAVMRYHPTIGEIAGVQLAAIAGDAGNYTLEAAIPWAAFGVTLNTDKLGLCVALSDNDHTGEARQDSMASHCTRLRISDPTTWVTAQLAP